MAQAFEQEFDGSYYRSSPRLDDGLSKTVRTSFAFARRSGYAPNYGWVTMRDPDGD
ncbi:MAG: hypothetical protein AAF631_09885 [Pseudomonadota bacterium]